MEMGIHTPRASLMMTGSRCGDMSIPILGSANGSAQQAACDAG